MQFGIFSVGDVTTDPTTGTTVSEHDRIQAMIAIALKTEDVGLDVFATGEHHNPPFVPSSPTTMLGYLAARTDRLLLSTATTLITTNDPNHPQINISVGLTVKGPASSEKSVPPPATWRTIAPLSAADTWPPLPRCSVPSSE